MSVFSRSSISISGEPMQKGDNKGKRAVVLVSGGMDSCVTAAVANVDYEMAFLHVNYRQRNEKRELKAFQDIADYYSVEKRIVIDFGFFKEIGGSSLTDKNIEPERENHNKEGVPSTYVPFRNANILSPAVSWAEVIDAEAIFIGAVEEDSSGYPDCRKEFYDAYNKVVESGTKPETKISVITPLIEMKKSEIIKLGLELEAPLHLSWSCYVNEDKACGECASCMLRIKAFEEAGVKDMVEYLE